MLQSGTYETPSEQKEILEPLKVGLDDKRLLAYFNNLQKNAEEHWDSAKGINLKARREQNIKYLFGKQLIGRELKPYESEFLDNIIYEFEAMLKSLATSKMPDIIIKAGGATLTEQKKKTAELLTTANKNRMLDRKFKKKVGILFKHLPNYFIAVYKYRWDANKNKIGDIEEEVRNPENIILDHTATEADPDKMVFIIDKVSKSAKEWAMLFPKKEAEIKKYVATKFPNLAVVNPDEDSKNDWLLAQKITAEETWFDWMDKAENFDTENPQFEYFSGVGWKLGKELLLGSSKNPNWDYEGHDVSNINGEPVDPTLIEQYAATGQKPDNLQLTHVFNNYFDFPKKPFILISFDQFLRSAVDETSRIEQNIPLQKSQDKVERQLDHMISNHKGKHIWSSLSGLTKKDLKKLDLDNPDNDILISGDPRAVHEFVQPVMPTPETFVHVRDRRERQFAKAGVHGATRGEITTQVATSNQISREADFTKSDDVVDETILHVTTEIAKARLHLMKLRYTPEHWNKLVGLEEGKYLELRLDNDSVENGMEVEVTASTTDKLRAERNAQAMMQAGYSDPLSFYEDMDIPNPELRAERLFLKDTNPNLYYQKFIQKKDLTTLANEVVSTNLPQSNPPGTTPPPVFSNPQTGTPPTQPPITPSPAQTGNVPATPQGSPRNLMGRMMGGIRNMMGV